MTLDLGVMSSSPKLSIELTLKYCLKNIKIKAKCDILVSTSFISHIKKPSQLQQGHISVKQKVSKETQR